MPKYLVTIDRDRSNLKEFEQAFGDKIENHPEWVKLLGPGLKGREVDSDFTDLKDVTQLFIFNHNRYGSTLDITNCGEMFSAYIRLKAELIVPGRKDVKIGFDGCMCKSCKTFYPMAAPNNPDGTMTCWSCRQYPFYK